jgi:hypothetical protein
MCSYHSKHGRYRADVPFADVLIKLMCMRKLKSATNM